MAQNVSAIHGDKNRNRLNMTYFPKGLHMIRNLSRALPIFLACAATSSAVGIAAPAKPAAKPATKPAAKPAEVTSARAMPALFRNSSASKITAVLAENGEVKMPVVISANASEETKGIAQELASYLGKISGADFKVETGDGTSGIVIGTIKDFPLPALDKALAVNGADGEEAFAIRTREKRIVLLAPTVLGVRHAAYRFLDILGVRWFFPAKHWEVVPQREKLTFNRDETDRPTILNRGVWVSWGFFGDTPAKQWEREHGKARSIDEYSAWSRHNAQGGSFGINTGHAWFEIIKNNPKLAEHPEYFPLIGGKRQVHWEAKLEMSNPAVRQVFVDYALAYFKANPDADMVSLDPTDGGGWSESAESAAMGTVSDQLFTMVNQVAREVKKKYPGKMVGLLAYNYHAMPPKFDLEDNIYIQLPTAFVQGKYTLDDLLELWPKKAKNFGVYDYYSVWLWRRDFLPGGTAANVPGLIAGIRNFAKIGVTSISAESGNDWGLSGRGYYMAAKLMWNPDADDAAISQDFYDKAFGKGSAAMKRYYERVEGANKNRLSRNTYALALRDVDEAGKAAKDDAQATARIDDIKQYLRYQHLNWEWDRVNTTDQITPEKQKAWLAREVQTYRERFSYMTHFAAQWQQGYISFDDVAKYPEAFADGKPFTRAERDAQWAEMMKAYKSLDFPERTFSTDLVPVNFPANAVPANAGAETRQHFPGRAGFLIYSDGTPTSVTIQTDLLPGFADRPEARWTLANTKNEEVAKGRMLLDGKSHELKWNLPAGNYGLDFDGAQGSWTLIAPKDQPVSQMLLKQWPRNQMPTVQDMYFYVPKGTKQITLAWIAAPLKLIAANGEEAKMSAQVDDTYVYDVPAGQDGKVWKTPQFALGHLWFANVPNILSASPGALLIPRDVVKADGLTIRK